MHHLLRQNEDGKVTIRWPIFVAPPAIYIIVSLATGLAMNRFGGRRFSIPAFLTFLIVTAIVPVLLLHIAKRRAEGKSLRQFSLSALLAIVTATCLLFGVMSWQRQSDVEASARRQRLQQEIMTLVGNGTVHVSNPAVIQVKRPTFNDDDLTRVVHLQSKLEEVGAPLGILDLTGTSVTDRGVSQLAMVKSLEFCFLGQTAISDASLDALKKLPRLKMLSVNSTRVTPHALLQFSKSRPQLNIEP